MENERQFRKSCASKFLNFCVIFFFWSEEVGFGGISRVLTKNNRILWRMPTNRSKSEKHDAAKLLRRDPYEVLSVSRNSTDQEIKSAYRRMALKYVTTVYFKLFSSTYRHYF